MFYNRDISVDEWIPFVFSVYPIKFEFKFYCSRFSLNITKNEILESIRYRIKRFSTRKCVNYVYVEEWIMAFILFSAIIYFQHYDSYMLKKGNEVNV